MADLSTTFTGIRFPNPFMLASAPPTESESNIRRAYDAGWGGVVTKTIGLHEVTTDRDRADHAALRIHPIDRRGLSHPIAVIGHVDDAAKTIEGETRERHERRATREDRLITRRGIDREHRIRSAIGDQDLPHLESMSDAGPRDGQH